MSKFKIHRLEGYIQNIYIAEYSDKLLLLDGGCRSDSKLIENFIINDLKRAVSDLKLMIVSHFHPDHCGAAIKLRKLHKIPIATHTITDNWYSSFGGFVQHEIDKLASYFVVRKLGKPWKRMKYPRFIKADYKLNDNDKLPFFDDWLVFFTPGHTSHDISIFNSFTKTIYLGDLMVEIRGNYMLPFPIVFPAKLKESMQRLSKLKIQKMLIAHGTVYDNADFNKILKRLSLKTFNKAPGIFKILRYFVKFTSEAKLV